MNTNEIYDLITKIEHTMDFSLTSVFGKTERQLGYMNGWRDFAKELRKALGEING